MTALLAQLRRWIEHAVTRACTLDDTCLECGGCDACGTCTCWLGGISD